MNDSYTKYLTLFTSVYELPTLAIFTCKLFEARWLNYRHMLIYCVKYMYKGIAKNVLNILNEKK